MWDQRWQNIVQGESWRETMRDDDPYMVWYRGIARRFITDHGYRNPIRYTPSTLLVHEMVCVVCNDVLVFHQLLVLIVVD